VREPRQGCLRRSSGGPLSSSWVGLGTLILASAHRALSALNTFWRTLNDLGASRICPAAVRRRTSGSRRRRFARPGNPSRPRTSLDLATFPSRVAHGRHDYALSRTNAGSSPVWVRVQLDRRVNSSRRPPPPPPPPPPNAGAPAARVPWWPLATISASYGAPPTRHPHAHRRRQPQLAPLTG